MMASLTGQWKRIELEPGSYLLSIRVKIGTGVMGKKWFGKLGAFGGGQLNSGQLCQEVEGEKNSWVRMTIDKVVMVDEEEFKIYNLRILLNLADDMLFDFIEFKKL